MMFLSIISIILLGASIAHSFEDRIIGGEETSIEDVPFQVAIFIYHKFHCGGSLLSRSFVLTAGHCVYRIPDNSGKITLKIGTNHSSWSHPSGLKINVEKFFVHPKFNGYDFDYDFALLKLKEFGELPVNVAFVQLPSVHDHLSDGEDVYITGWGKTEEGLGAEVLRRAVVPIFSFKKCEWVYHNYYDVKITDRMICAGFDDGGIDACKGDSGGPLLRKSDGVQFGITSFGNGCALPGYPGVYAKISSVLDWIDSITNKY